ncbi:MAG: hypothetical protein WKG32_02015 [Gemmatimonadaceae bacterium]
MRHRVSALCTFALVLAGLAPVGLRAQAVLGIGDDALVLPVGALRLRVLPTWTRFDSRYGKNTPNRAPGSLEPLAVDFNRDTIGIVEFERLLPLRDGLRLLAGLPDFDVSLGRTIVRLDASVLAYPIVAELGLTKRFSVGVIVPIVRTRTEARLNVNPLGREGNLGFNPALADTNIRNANNALYTQYATAVTALQALITSCANTTSTDPRCPTVRARSGTLTALAAGAAQFSGGLQSLYGASPFIPLTGTDVDAAIRARVAGFSSQFATLATLNIPAFPSGSPVAAQSLIGVNDAQRILGDPAFGVGVDPLQTIERTGIGDIEVGAKFQFLNTLEGEGKNQLDPPSGLNFRSAVTGLVRIGSGHADTPDNFIDIGTGNGQNDIEIRSQSDVIFGKRLWASVVGRYGIQLGDRQTMRITDADQPLAFAYRRFLVDRDLGDFFELELTPRFVISDYFAVSGSYLYRNKQEDRYSGTFQTRNTLDQDITLNAATLNAETEQTEHRVIAGITYSTLAAFQKGRARVPLEIFVQHAESVNGSGGSTPRIRQNQVQLRVYTRIFGGDAAK